MENNMNIHSEEIFEIEPVIVSKPRINRNREKIIIKTPNYEHEQETNRRHQREKINL